MQEGPGLWRTVSLGRDLGEGQRPSLRCKMLAMCPPLRQWFGAFAGGMQWNRNVCAEPVGARAILVPQVGALGILVARPAHKERIVFQMPQASQEDWSRATGARSLQAVVRHRATI